MILIKIDICPLAPLQTESNPPVEFPVEIAGFALPFTGPSLFASVCSQCHGVSGEGGIGPSFQTDEFQTKYTDTTLVDVISTGHPATAMIAWGEILSTDQIALLVETIRNFSESEVEEPQDELSFSTDVLPVLDANCKFCHGSLGVWDGTSYEAVMTSGDNSPTVIPGDTQASLLAQKATIACSFQPLFRAEKLAREAEELPTPTDPS